MYPELEGQLTTIKKRTMTQGQFHKAYKTIEESKDKIISTLKIKGGSIMYINGRLPNKDNYVPTD
jgi:major membrane immunogen (membrane-anchored lipoprotein)